MIIYNNNYVIIVVYKNYCYYNIIIIDKSIKN